MEKDKEVEMRKKKKTIILAKIRRYLRRIGLNYLDWLDLEYPICYRKTEKELQKTAERIYKLFKPSKVK